MFFSKMRSGVHIHRPVKIIGMNNIEFGNNIIIDSFTYIYAKKKMKIGSNVFISSFVFLNGSEIIEIGDFSGIYQGVKLHSSTDDFKGWGIGGPPVEDKYRNSYRAPVRIGKFAVVGANSVVLPGVTIGEGASVGACSVVTRNLEPWGIYIGNKKIGQRDKDAVMENYKHYLSDHNM